METSSNIVLTKRYLKKLTNVFGSVIPMMGDEELVSITFLNNTIVVETDDIVTIVKLENQ